MTEWVLIIWVYVCGWSCEPDSVMEFATYESKSECEAVLAEWSSETSFRPVRGGKCLEREASGEQ